MENYFYLDLSAAVHRRAGLGRYAESLARALVPRMAGRLAFFYNQERGIAPLPGLESLPARTVSLGYKPWRMLVWLGQLARIGFNRWIPGAAGFHATEHLLLPLRGIPTVLTVHDLIFHRMPEHHKRLNRWYLNWTMPLYCRRADRIIAVSEQTRRDLIQIYRIPPQKIRVIYEAAGPQFRPAPAEAVAAARTRYALPERYLLFVGTIEPRKNLTRLLQAFAPLQQAGLTDGLVIVGKRGWLCEDFFRALEGSPVREFVHFPGFVADADLPALYTGAQALAFPSLYEGFGLPLLEALACGTPAACSNVSSLPEIGGEAALYFDPTAPEDITQTLRRLLTDRDLAADLSRRGQQRAAQFSWERTAEATLSVYQEVQ